LFPSDPDYLPLWRYFLRSILVHRVIPYFPKLDWSDILAGRSGGSSGGSEGTGGVNGCGRIGEAEWSIVVVLCDCIEELLGQDKLPHNSAERLATLWGHNSARMGFFHLVHRFVVIEGPNMRPEDVRELRKQVAMFQRKALSSDDVSCARLWVYWWYTLLLAHKVGCLVVQVLVTLDGILAVCEIYT
jgi:hypothetical protein